jgi:hypothetical protein
MIQEETTITVRGVDLHAWKEFQKAIIDGYGHLSGNLGIELTKALGYWLEKRIVSKGTEEVNTPEVKQTNSMNSISDFSKYVQQSNHPSQSEMIRDAMTNLGGEATIQQVQRYLNDKYRGLNQGSISTSMSDLSVNGPPSSLYPMDRRFLERISRGKYRIVSKDGESNGQ